MQVLNATPNISNTTKTNSSLCSILNTPSKNSSFIKSSSESDTVSFGRRRESDDIEEERETRPRRKSAGKKFFRGTVGILAALGLTAGGIQAHNAGIALLAQRALEDAFRENPKNIATCFINTFVSNEEGFGADTMHFEQSGESIINPFEIKSWDDSFPGPQSTVTYDFADGAFSSASLDIDGDGSPEITVTTDEDGDIVISYDYDSDGKIDTIETLQQKDK